MRAREGPGPRGGGGGASQRLMSWGSPAGQGLFEVEAGGGRWFRSGQSEKVSLSCFGVVWGWDRQPKCVSRPACVLL